MSQVELTTLGKSCEFFNGKAHEKSIDENGKYIVVNSKFISSEGKSFKRTNEQMFPLYKGDIVMVMSDVPNGKALAKCFIIDKDDTYSLNQRICCIRSKEFDAKYLYYQLNRHEHFLAFNNGENQTNLRKDDILACPLIKPSIDEQRRMVEKLDQTFASLLKVKFNIETNIINAKELIDGELQSVFDQNSGIWQTKTLKEICVDLLQGINTATDKTEFVESGIPIFQAKEIGEDKLELDNCKFITESKYNSAQERYKPKLGDILYNNIGSSMGRGIVVNWEYPFTIAWNIMRIIPNRDIVEPYFLNYILKSNKVFNDIKYKSKGVGMPFIPKKDLAEISVTFPPLKEQSILVNKLDSLQKESKRIIHYYTEKLILLDELSQTILKKAFENELIEAE